MPVNIFATTNVEKIDINLIPLEASILSIQMYVYTFLKLIRRNENLSSDNYCRYSLSKSRSIVWKLFFVFLTSPFQMNIQNRIIIHHISICGNALLSHSMTSSIQYLWENESLKTKIKLLLVPNEDFSVLFIVDLCVFFVCAGKLCSIMC